MFIIIFGIIMNFNIKNHIIDIAFIAAHAYIVRSNEYTLNKLNTMLIGGILLTKIIEAGTVIELMHDYDKLKSQLPTFIGEFSIAVRNIAQQQNRQPVPPAYDDSEESINDETDETSEEQGNAE